MLSIFFYLVIFPRVRENRKTCRTKYRRRAHRTISRRRQAGARVWIIGALFAHAHKIVCSQTKFKKKAHVSDKDSLCKTQPSFAPLRIRKTRRRPHHNVLTQRASGNGVTVSQYYDNEVHSIWTRKTTLRRRARLSIPPGPLQPVRTVIRSVHDNYRIRRRQIVLDFTVNPDRHGAAVSLRRRGWSHWNACVGGHGWRGPSSFIRRTEKK